MLFTEMYKDKEVIILTAQICGAELVKGMFPRWMVNKYNEEGKIEVQCTGNDSYTVTVRDGGKSNSRGCKIDRE